MKKLLALALSVLSIGFWASSVQAKATGSPSSVTKAAQIKVQIGGNNRRRNRRVIKTTRVLPNRRRVVTRTVRSNGRRTVVRTRVIRRNGRRN